MRAAADQGGRARTRRSASCPAATSRRCCWPAGWPCSPKVLLLDEPTRGIDVGAKAEVQALIDELAEDGLGVLLISSDLEELVEGADRVVVLQGRRGRRRADRRRRHRGQADARHRHRRRAAPPATAERRERP